MERAISHACIGTFRSDFNGNVMYSDDRLWMRMMFVCAAFTRDSLNTQRWAQLTLVGPQD
jgi:hypothetical protein